MDIQTATSPLRLGREVFKWRLVDEKYIYSIKLLLKKLKM